ncbi:MAG: PilT/PilU family type 4a pilus ATPase [Candidatus Uhrbacteria bacterium]
MPTLENFVREALKNKASDIHLVAGSQPFLRLSGKLQPLRATALTKKEVDDIVTSVLTKTQISDLSTRGDVDAGLIVDDVSLRINIHKQARGLGLAIRLIPAVIPSPEDLGFDQALLDIPNLKDGFVLISGPAGSGKTTTLAALVQMMNKGEARHIITLEDPIEYHFDEENCLIEQRQLGTDFSTFADGLRHVLRQDPNVIVVGEMRDPETIALALTAAETGHLVLSTVHAPNTAEVIERIVNVFSGAQQQQVLVQLAATLRLVVAQRLVPAQAGGVVAVREILVPNAAVQNAIRQNNLATIRSAIQTGRRQGMVTMEQAMNELIKAKII